MMSTPASQFFKTIKEYHTNVDDDFEQPELVIPRLRAYQRRAVKWMLDRETNNDMVKSDGSPFSGGILADEMGLGKTVEMLCCIMANPSPSEFYDKKIEIADSLNDTQNTSTLTTSKPSTSKYVYASTRNIEKQSIKRPRKLLESWYESVLNEMSTVSKKTIMENSMDDNSLTVECYCTDIPSDNTLVVCAVCEKTQHASCVNFNPKPFQEVPFLCANCWTLNGTMQCKATLIVVPQSILNQWIDEIDKHITKPGLNVLIYNGVHLDGYIQPISFNDYDIVLTSYAKLSNDLNYVGNDLENGCTSRLRHSKRYNYPMSPLPCIKWWRICLDEGQAIESGTNKISEMTSCLKSVHRWAMTGTPVQKSLNDLYGILKFLDVGPYCDRKQFSVFMKGEVNLVYEWFSKIIWRNSVNDVNTELNLPVVTTENHWLTFSEIEKYFYISQHDECAKIFSNEINRIFDSLDISLKHIDKHTIYSIIGPLYKLRQACVHPQAINGQFLKVKGTMTMEKLMDVMIEKCRVECNDILRSLVSEHNAIAGLYLIQTEPAIAVIHYRNVLSLMEKYKEKNIKVDTCQKIHVMYNLTKVLDEHAENSLISHKISDNNLKNDMEHLEKEYLDASKQNIESTRKTVELYSDKVAEIIQKRTLGYSDWWSDLLDWIFSPRDFLIKVQAELEDYRVPGVPNIANKLKSVNDVFTILSVWLADLDSARTEAISKLNTLEKTSMNDLVHSAIPCHLRQGGAKPKKTPLKNRCLLCKAENQLQLYESLLFSVSNKQKNITNNKTEEEDDESVYESTSKGLWKMSQKEFLLMKLFQYGQAKIINNNCLKDATEHMKVLTLVRKEFRYLRLLWTHLSDSLSAHDEIVMAKQRLRLGDSLDLQPETDADGPPKKKKKKQNKECDIIMEAYVTSHVMDLETSIPLSEARLKQKIRTLLYLENLKKEQVNSSDTECPICSCNVDSGWAVLLCGHSICSKCLATMCRHSEDLIITCPMCRSNTPMDSISYVKSNQEEASNIAIKGSFSTKIESVTMKIMELIAQDPKVKVLIFSTWEKALNVLGEALEQNSVNYRILKNGTKYKKTLNDFKTNANINALLMKLSLGSKGLNLTEATRIFFMEPIINKADQYQAIGRIHRIGQTKPTFVHHFIIRDSIEENITKIFSSNLLDKWDDITLSQMITVFQRNQTDTELLEDNTIN